MHIPYYDISLLYVEDETATREQIRHLLERTVSTLYVATNGQQGLELFQTHNPDIVLTDIRMPVMSGLEMSREIRLLSPDCQIIILTAYSDTEYLLDCISIGINQYTQKPVDYAKLTKAIGICSNYILLKRLLKKQNDYIHLLSQAMEQAPTLVMITDLDGDIEYVNTMFTRVTGYTAQEVLGRNPRILKSGLTPQEVYQELWQAIRAGQEWETELPNRRKNGEIYWEGVKICPLRDASGNIKKYLRVSQDITGRKQYEEKLQFLSTHDPLTGLYNRAYFEAEMKRLAVSRDFPVSIIMADIDGLKMVNDTWGHDEGDQVIRKAAESILVAYRAGDVVARIGGDEFAVLLPHTDEEAALAAVERIRTGCSEVMNRQNELLKGLSLGVATADKGTELESALKNADTRMYLDKNEKNTCPKTHTQNNEDTISGD